MILCITAMTKQCGTCRWWDYNNADWGFSDCLAPIPDCLEEDDKARMDMYDGETCPVYEDNKLQYRDELSEADNFIPPIQGL